MKAKKYLIEDAVNSTKAALKAGIVAGGGSALLRAKHEILKENKVLEGSSQVVIKSKAVGRNILLTVLERPLLQIANNAGKNPVDILTAVVSRMDDGNSRAGYDAKNEVIVDDMIAAGIIDPVQVAKSALQNAVSAATMFLTTDAVVSEIPEKEKEMAMGGGGMPGMGGMM